MNYFFKYLRHRHVLKRLTPARVLNSLLLCLETKLRKKRLRSRPVIARINTYPLCNLRCRACQLIAAATPDDRQRVMPLPHYRQLLDKLSRQLLLVVLYDEGEPLLHPELPEMIAYTASLNISTSISTNLAMPLTDGYLQRLVASGLNRITVSIDGITQEVYQKYRVGGELALVKKNLDRLVMARRTAGSRLLIEVQFLKFGFNDHEMEGVKEFAKTVGADYFRALPSSPSGLVEYLAERRMTLSEHDHLRLGCFDLFSIAHINSCGELFPCDFGEDNGMAAVGNLLEQDLEAVWNSTLMQERRAAFRRDNRALDCAICKRCPSTNRTPLFLR